MIFAIESKKSHRTQALKRLIVVEPPNNLIINLKRFTQMGFAFSKNSKRVKFSMTLDLDDFMVHSVLRSDSETLE